MKRILSFCCDRTQPLEIPAEAGLEPQLADLLHRMLAKVRFLPAHAKGHSAAGGVHATRNLL